jgi:hypothetical protein
MVAIDDLKAVIVSTRFKIPSVTSAVVWLSFVHIRKSSTLPSFHSVIYGARELRVVTMMSFRVLDMMHCLRGQFGYRGELVESECSAFYSTHKDG